jgi:hypothetical protein
VRHSEKDRVGDDQDDFLEREGNHRVKVEDDHSDPDE